MFTIMWEVFLREGGFLHEVVETVRRDQMKKKSFKYSLPIGLLNLRTVPISKNHDICKYQTGCNQRMEMLPNIGGRWFGWLPKRFRNY
jgi:hypothetical protein